MIDLSDLQHLDKDSFKAFLGEFSTLQNLKSASNVRLQSLGESDSRLDSRESTDLKRESTQDSKQDSQDSRHDLGAFDFKNSIIFATNADLEADLKPAENTKHKNLAFTLIPTQTHKKADLVRATKAINTAIPSYNIIFFVGKDSRDSTANPKLSIAFASRRWHKGRIVETDIITKITLIKDIDIFSPSLAHKLNLESIA